MRKFGQDRLQGMMDKVGMDDETPIEHNWITKAIEKAQKRVEEKHFAIRKQLLKFDDVMTIQRQTIYSLRNEILHGDELKNKIWEMIENLVDDNLDFYLINPDLEEESGVEVFAKWLTRTFPIDLSEWSLPIDQQEIYFTPEYYELYENNGEGKAICFVYKEAEDIYKSNRG